MGDKPGSKKTKVVPFCDDCPYAVDFGPWVSTPLGSLPTKVKHIGAVVACATCPHQEARQRAMEGAQQAA